MLRKARRAGKANAKIWLGQPLASLAIFFSICNAERVKKILFGLILSLLSLLIYSISSPAQVLADKDGKVEAGGACVNKGEGSCKPGLDCAGLDRIPGTDQTIRKGECVEKVKLGGACLPTAGCKTFAGGKCFGECEEGLKCDVQQITKEVAGKCVEKGPPPPAPAPPCAVNNEKGPCPELNTAFGKLSTKPEQFIGRIFAVILSASGAIALILMMRAGYKILMSKGKPETIQEGRDQLTSAIVGLMFVIFAFVFLELIGVDILRIPGFGGSPWTCRFGGAC